MRHLLVVLFAFVVSGCSVNENSVTEEDRVLVDLNIQIAKKQQASARMLVATMTNDPISFTLAMKELEQLNSDQLANNEQLQKNWKPPKQPKVYDPNVAKDYRTASDKSHLPTGWWAWLLGALGTGGSIALGIARSPLARLLPGFGPVFTALDTTLTAVESWMQKKKASGEGLVAEDLAKVLELAHADKNVGNYIDKKLDAVKEKLGVDVLSLAGVAPATNPPSSTGAPTS